VNAWLGGSQATTDEFIGVHIPMTGSGDNLEDWIALKAKA